MVKSVVIALVCVAIPIASSAQTRPASFSGVVYDPGGVVVANAKVVLSSVQSDVTHEVRSDDHGRFEILRVPAGAYRLDVWATDQSPRLANGANLQMSSTMAFGGVDLKKLGDEVKLASDENLERDVALQLGPLQIVVTVRPETAAASRELPRPSLPDDWRCVGVEAPFCGPVSLVAEFEEDLRKAGRIPADVQPPRQIIRPSVLYPTSLEGSPVEGTVRLVGRIGTDGFLIELEVVGVFHPDLVQAALDGMTQARWEPARLRGTLIEVPIELTIDFQVR